ncbi:MAG: hypothetical protein RR853_00785 [Aurantimicrobium sp.]|jgi:hypothetical protein|uniref:hypothetical protein n=1 Tax=Aurantimicrobium TaxID=1705353 RepID=UPI0024051010|nr:hypothetical protein [Aurantimicrobium minutum]MDF9809708.1 hypothetical protein [Aurantimicrobium minutum]
MSFLSFDHVAISERFIRHVLEGEPESTLGGHKYGMSRPGKTEFPVSWTEEHIVEAMNTVLQGPEVVTFSGKRIFLQKTVRGVHIELKLLVTKKGLTPVSCFPIGGEGVVRNVAGRQIPLDTYKENEGE